MKKPSFLYLSLAAIVAGSFSSCQEETFASKFGFESDEELRSYIAAEKVAGSLTESLGLEVNHKADQFGFDVAAQALSLAETRAGTRAAGDLPSGIYKPEENLKTIAEKYGTVPNITEREHKEVFAWFSSHKVEWENTPVNYDGYHPTRQLKGANGVYGIAKVIEDSPYLAHYGSLKDYSINQLGDARIGSAVYFNYSWVQYVASEADTDYGFGFENPKDEVNVDGGGAIYGTDKMNQLGIWDGSQFIHTNEFNGNQSNWGYSNQNGVRDGYKKNGVFFCNIDCSQITSQSSAASSLNHDKWIIVSLKGADYEGTYVGIDHEACGINRSEQYPANGICNDWIIKISPSTTNIDDYGNYRIMCEDLGASFDVDYNDLVIDVEWDGTLNGGWDPQLRAKIVSACGSLPISIWIDQPTIIPPFHNYVYSGEIHELLGGKMKSDGTYDPIAPNQITTDKIISASRGYWTSGNTEELINAIDIKVCQDPAAWKKAKQKGKMAERAIWTSLHNFEGKVPLKICVPQKVRIATESGIDGDRRFETAYPLFYKWLQNDPQYAGTGYPFWDMCNTNFVY